MKIKGPKQLGDQVQMAGKCCNCGACIELCPYFKHHLGKTVNVFECDFEMGRCHAYCPKIDVDYPKLSQELLGKAYQNYELGDYKDIKAAKAGDKLPKHNYQAGGTVSALISFGLEHGYFKAAVLTDSLNGRPRPRIASTVKDILSCASSKFASAPTLSALNRALHDGVKEIGVVGTPCQMTAVAQMKYNQLDIEKIKDCNIFTVGLFCNWALSPHRFMQYIEEKYDVQNIISMDIPPPPEETLILKTREQDIEIPLKEIRPYISQSCSNCADLTSEWADISVGMFEGRPGWNTIIIRSDTGMRMVNEACESGYLVVEEIPEKQISHLKQAAQNKRQRALNTTQKTK